MDFIWYDYNPDTMNYIEDWLDEITVRNTGLDDGFRCNLRKQPGTRTDSNSDGCCQPIGRSCRGLYR